MAPKSPNLPKAPNLDIRVVRRAREAIRDAIKMIKKSGVSLPKQKEMQELLEAVRRAGYAEGYAAAKMEAALGGVENQESASTASAVQTAPPLDTGEYVSRTPFNTTRSMALDYLRNTGRPAGPTEIIRNTQRNTGVRLTMTTLRRALDDLANSGQVEEVDNSRWQIKETGRTVPLRPVK